MGRHIHQRIKPWVWCIGASLLVSGCNMVPKLGDQDGPGKQVSAKNIPDAVPVRSERSELGNHSPYQVAGRSYYVMKSAEGYRARGVASWYGKKFHGRLTSSGEPFDMYLPTAAHRNLPLPAYVLVRNLDNGKQAILKVNDRGPFVDDRIIDVSYGAAIKLGMMKQGTANVEVTALTDSNIHLVGGWQEPSAPETLEAFDQVPPSDELMASESRGLGAAPLEAEESSLLPGVGAASSPPSSRALPRFDQPSLSQASEQALDQEFAELGRQQSPISQNADQVQAEFNRKVQAMVEENARSEMPASGSLEAPQDARSRGLAELARYGYDQGTAVSVPAPAPVSRPAAPSPSARQPQVQLEPLGARAPQRSVPAAAPVPINQPVQRAQDGRPLMVLQAGAFSSYDNASRLRGRLSNVGYPVYIEQINTGPEAVYRVRLGPFSAGKEALAMNKLDQVGYQSYRLLIDQGDGRCLEGC